MKAAKSNDQEISVTFTLRIAMLINYFNRDYLTVDEHRELDEWVTANMINQRFFETLTDPGQPQNQKG